MEAKEYTGWRHGTSKQHAPQDRIQKNIPKRRKKSQNNSPSNNHHAINGKIHYFYAVFSIAFCMFTRGYIHLWP